MTNKDIARSIREKALELGFEGCGIIPVSDLLGYGEKLKERQAVFPMAKGPMADMLGRYADISPVYPWAKAVIVCTTAYGNYKVPENLVGLIGRYYLYDHKLQAHSRMYGSVEAFEAFIRALGKIRVEKELHGVTSGRWAAMKAGLGIIRKNNFLYTKSGSRVIIDTWVIDLPLEYREENSFPPCPEGCRKCIEACPTKSLLEPYCMNLAKCVTLLTWGLKDLPPEPIREPLGQWIYGCDACQDACPYNPKTDAGEEYPGLAELAEALSPEKIAGMDYAELTGLLASKFWFIRPENIWIWKANALRAMANAYREEYRDAILSARSDENEKVREMAGWAASKCGLA
jgi:epoxyqueuosine reductase